MHALAAAPAFDTATLVDRIQTEIVDPVSVKPYEFASDIDALRAELKRVCGTTVVDEAADYLATLDCWITETLGWWSQVEVIARQAATVADALASAAGRISDAKLADAHRDIAAKFRRIGQGLLAQAIEWKPVVRQVGSVSHTIRDLVVGFNTGVETGELDSSDPATDALRLSLERLVVRWKLQIVNRVVDVAFVNRTFALLVADRINRLVAIQFDLSAALPGFVQTVGQLLDSLERLEKLSDLASLPAQALRALLELPAQAAAKGGEALFPVIAQFALLGLGVGAALVGGLVILKKTGVIETIPTRR